MRIITGTLAALLLAFAPALPAQQEVRTVPPLPEGPLLTRAPEMAHWSVESSFENGSSPEILRAALAEGRLDPEWTPRIRRVEIWKTKNVTREILEDELGQKFEKWGIGKRQIAYIPETKVYIWLNPPPNGGGMYSDYSITDFPGMEWVAPKTFLGVQPVQGKEVLVFGDNEKRSASIDTASRLPIRLNLDRETRIYRFQAAPTAMLIPPPDFQNAFAEQQARLDRYNRVRTKP